MQNRIFNSVLIYFILLGDLSCTETEDRRVRRLIKEWYGKEIVLPMNIPFTIMGDSNACLSDYNLSNKTKIVSYADSSECISCDLNLLEWADFMKKADSITNNGISFYFYFSSTDETELISSLKLEGFDYPIFIDKEKTFEKTNQLPADKKFRTFLLDKDNKVILIGNPTHGMEDLYIKVLSQ